MPEALSIAIKNTSNKVEMSELWESPDDLSEFEKQLQSKLEKESAIEKLEYTISAYNIKSDAHQIL